MDCLSAHQNILNSFCSGNHFELRGYHPFRYSTNRQKALFMIHKERHEAFIYISGYCKLFCNANCNWPDVRSETNSIALAISAVIDKVGTR